MCYTPIRIKAKKKGQDGMVSHSGHAVVPCGKCPDCKMKRAKAWIFRILKEERIHNNAVFATLTYSQENVPITPKGFMTLDKADFQKFMKRLRFNTGVKTIKYYAAGEYGDDTMRPHYHAIIFDVTKDDIDRAWGLGHTVLGSVTGASIGYCTKYICKDKRVPLHCNDDRQREFSLMSKRMGKNYLTPQVIKWHQQNKASYVLVEGGYKQPLPRYFRDFIFTEDAKQELNQIAQEKHAKKLAEDIDNAGSSTEYYRERFEQIRQTIINKNKSQKRNKI